MRVFWLLALVPLVAAGCAGDEKDKSNPAPGPHDGLVAGAPVVLSPPNPNASPKDEDACIFMNHLGHFYVAWMSNRDGNDEIYVMRSSDGQFWSSPNRVTTSADADWYPTMLRHGGRYHMVWMRQTATTRTVWYNSSPDGITWNAANETPVTTGTQDDFVPHMIEIGGVLHVYFDSYARSGDGTRGLFHVQSTGYDMTGAVNGWTSPVEIASLNHATESDQLPYVIARPSGGYLMSFIRHTGSATAINGYLDPTSDINWATSSDGVTWTYGGAVMPEDGATDTIPALYIANGQETFSFMRGISAQPWIIDYDYSLVGSWPTGWVNVSLANGVNGWSSRVTPTLKTGTFLRVFVRASDLRLMLQVFTR
ncbi:MAG: hypothetical protein HS108_09720 [Planctomycetes bacterium]|jgi:hypothetical protein|nr:hypothetical protein [Planctomycetota bacterium]MCL4728887.1 hypothetical protein [Planctomycetota bacterium]